ncbi:hypothetical protein [Microtetraspora sp. NBRC 16547]|uniref:hypothetical protein n=1 Tax=Microtetraspora sp. NBRC 16547 TaxID=3030993 RepID=UPI0024A10375|nr:hypothetical protein [Microtetraspora sp. NBRC 16547]GLX02065.1 hypothetical protein Misp02_61510 [Microtetraspora sp. NBRC 16547]
MWRSRGFRLWAVATVMTLLPLALWVLPDSVLAFSFGLVNPPTCPAFEFQTEIYSSSIVTTLLGWDFVAVPLAFAFWLVTRGGRPSRVAARAIAAYVLLPALLEPALIAYDLFTVGSACWETWQPTAGWDLGMGAYQMTCAIFILLAVRPAGPASPRRIRLRRTAGAVVVCCLLLGLIGVDQGPDHRFTGADVAARSIGFDSGYYMGELDADLSWDSALPGDGDGYTEEANCGPWTVIHRSYGDTAPGNRELAFLCLARDVGGYASRLVTLPDRELLMFGRALCGVAGRPSTEPRVRTLLDQVGADYGWSYALMRALVFLCPDAVARTWPDLVLSEAESQRKEELYQAKMTSHCADPARRLRAVRQATTALFVGEGGGYFIEDGDSEGEDEASRPLNKAFDAILWDLSAHRASVATAVENYHVCLTVKVLRHAPRVRLKGWDTVVETGVDTPSGRLGLTSWETGEPLPNLAASGPGRYRIRIYVRNQEEAATYASKLPVEEHLVLVYPGRSSRTVFLRK